MWSLFTHSTTRDDESSLNMGSRKRTLSSEAQENLKMSWQNRKPLQAQLLWSAAFMFVWPRSRSATKIHTYINPSSRLKNSYHRPRAIQTQRTLSTNHLLEQP